MEALAFLDRLFQRVPKNPGSAFKFDSWNHGGKSTSEGFGLLPTPGVDPEKVIACVMNVDAYVGNVDHVMVSKSIQDPRFTPPEKVHFYQKLNIPMLAKIQMENVLVDAGERDGYRVAYWYQLDDETKRLNKKEAARSAYNLGAWIAKPGFVGYALCSAPMKEDVGRLKFAAMTRGADVAAPKIVRANIEGMVKWSKRT